MRQKIKRLASLLLLAMIVFALSPFGRRKAGALPLRAANIPTLKTRTNFFDNTDGVPQQKAPTAIAAGAFCCGCQRTFGSLTKRGQDKTAETVCRETVSRNEFPKLLLD